MPPLCRAADANERGGAGGEALRANRPAAHIAYFVHARFNFAESRVDRREVLAFPRQQCGNMLPFEGDRRAFWVVLVVAAGGALATARDDGIELFAQVSDPGEYQCPIGIQQRLG